MLNNIQSMAIEGLISKLANKGVQLNALPVAIYARKSTVDKSEVSIEGQVDMCKKLIKGDKRLKLTKIYFDEDKTGYYLDNRKQFNKLMDDVKQGSIKVVVAYSLSRISRNSTDSGLLDREFSKYDVIDLYATQSFSDNADGHFMKNITRALDQKVPEDTSENIIKSCVLKAKEGNFLGGKVPYGFNCVKKILTINDVEATAVRQMFNDAASGLTITEITEHLKDLHYTNRSGKPFPSNTIWTMLKNERYTGTYIYAKANGRKRKTRVSTQNLEEIRIDNRIPQIIDKQLFKQANAMLDKKKARRNKQTDYLLTGLLFCNDSKAKMHGETNNNGHGCKYSMYASPRNNPVSIRIKKDAIERATAQLLLDILNQIYKIKSVSTNIISSIKGTYKSQLSSIAMRLKNAEENYAEIVGSLAKTSEKNAIKLINDAINEQQRIIDGLNAEKEDLIKQNDVIKEFIKNVSNGTVQITCEDILENKNLFRKLAFTFIKEILVSKDNVTFNLNDLE